MICLDGIDHLKTRVISIELSMKTIVIDPDKNGLSTVVTNIKDNGLISFDDNNKLKSSI